MEKKGLGVRKRWFPMHCGGFHAPDTPPGDNRVGGGHRGYKAMGHGPRWSLAGGGLWQCWTTALRCLLSPGWDSASLLQSSLVIL